MKKKSSESPNRRKFISLGVLGGAALLTGQAGKILTAEEGEDEKVSMLTPDGRLVEVSKKILAQSEEKSKASNQNILDWRTSPENHTT